MYRVSSLLTAFCVFALASTSFAQVPGGLPDGVNRIKADTAVFVDAEERPALGNWEPYSSVLGNSMFLIESNKYADNPDDPFTSNQSYGIAIQPVAGGANTEVEAFWGDDGFPYNGPINNYRQNGNPGRVAGDKRPGALNYITGGEASPDEFDDFLGDDRFENITRNGRYGTVQLFSYADGGVTPSSNALDAVNGRFADDADLTGVGGEIGRFGGELAALSNGNFLAVVDDKAGLHNFSNDGAAVRAATGVILAPNGSIVKDSFVICAEAPVEGEPCADTQIWSNVAAGNGFFCARVRATLVFFSNSGDRLGAIGQDASGLAFDGGRGDGTRIAGHPNSNYIYLAGGTGGNDISVAAFDGRDQSFVAATTVNEADFGAPGRTGVAVDALNRVAICWGVTVAAIEAPAVQVVSRVLSFDGAAYTAMTPTFFAFTNFYNEAGAPAAIESRTPNISMTTREICVAAKGTINLENMPQDGGNSVNEQNFYTVFSHPDPQADPTASGAPFIPGSAEDAGLGRIKADTAVFVDAEERPALGNWEAYSSTLGNSMFLIESNKYADNPDDPFTSNQSYGIAIQPVTGGPNTEVEAFYGDDGFPYNGPINNYRQNGNPGRVAGDKRPGGTNYITGGEASPDEFQDFLGDDRFENITRNGRYGTVQLFAYTDGGVTPTSNALDAVNGRFADDADLTGVGGEIGRFGGELAGLSNGNFLAVVDDKAGLHNFSNDGAAVRAATGVILAPDGSVVKDSFVICAEDPVEGEPCADTQIWSNVAAGNGFFCARVRSTLVFYSNDGDRLGAIGQAASGLNFDGGRGDGTRIAGHPNSNYIYLAGSVGDNNIGVAAFDGRDQSFAAASIVNEANFSEPPGRTGVAVDALDRVAIAWGSTIAAIEAPAVQVVCRVLSFSGNGGGAGTAGFSPMTPTFFAFNNFYNETGAPAAIESRTPNVSMTTEAICVTAKGTINLENMPQDGGNSVNEQNFYTVFAHPDRQDDPTAPAGGVGPFARGDCNADGNSDLSDGVAQLNFSFLGGAEPPCKSACDFSGDGQLGITNAVYFFNALFQGGPPVAEPRACEVSGLSTDIEIGCADASSCAP